MIYQLLSCIIIVDWLLPGISDNVHSGKAMLASNVFTVVISWVDVLFPLLSMLDSPLSTS